MDWEEEQFARIQDEMDVEDRLFEMMVDHYGLDLDPKDLQEAIMLTYKLLQRALYFVIENVENKYHEPIIKEWARDFENRNSKDITLRELYFLLDLALNEPYLLALYDLYKLHQEIGREWNYDVIPTFEFPDVNQDDDYPF